MRKIKEIGFCLLLSSCTAERMCSNDKVFHRMPDFEPIIRDMGVVLEQSKTESKK